MDKIPNNHQDGAGGSKAPEEEYRIPKATVARVMRMATPPKPNYKITGDAKEAVYKCVAEFAAVVIGAAAQECRQDKRLTVTGDDLILAMSNLGFDDYVGPLTEYLRRYRESEGTMPRARHSTMMPLAAPAPVAPAGVEAEAQPLSPGLTMQLGTPSVRDVTELGVHADVYAVRRGGGAAPAGTSLAPPAADDDEAGVN